ncbi:MAG: hypothetical protein JO115_20085 [Pseudonocardiales bacterium]|nr:hypothetical protein [Pseudonocardiales bacterium]
MDAPDASAIGARARMIRHRRGLIEDLANALGCSVADLTGQPYLPPDRASAAALTTLPSIRLALNDFGPIDPTLVRTGRPA